MAWKELGCKPETAFYYRMLPVFAYILSFLFEGQVLYSLFEP